MPKIVKTGTATSTATFPPDHPKVVDGGGGKP
jgi:hypothetical protein